MKLIFKGNYLVRMDPCLLQQIDITIPAWRKYSRIPVLGGYKEVTTLTPIIQEILGEQTSEGQLNSDSIFLKLKDFHGSGECIIETISKDGVKKDSNSFCKVTHILDPILSLKGYYKHSVKGKNRVQEKMRNPMNKAYIDTLANYLLGQLRERDVSPHFCLFYGGFKAIAEKYRFNINDEFNSFRRYREFWNKKRSGDFDLYIEREDNESIESSLFKTPQSSMRSTAFSYTSSDSEFSESISIANENISHSVELESVHSFETRSSDTSNSDSTDYSDSHSTFDENVYSVYSEFKEYPVMLIFQEKMEGVLDDMLEDDTLVGAQQGSPDWEARWIAWTFQIIAALCAAQGVLGFTHNDLHTNNIVWAFTEEEWLFYRNRSGIIWRVPTYGRIFRIIDFGRSIFRIKQKWFISDDYSYGGDAEGQFHFDCAKNGRKEEIYPNPSFDLCRYAVSVIDTLFPIMPVEKLDGKLLSKEDSWEIHETESPLWNLLWSWLIDKEGRNVLKDECGDERFPDFDLYNHITENVEGVKPQEQLMNEIFSSFQIEEGSLGNCVKVYSLFC